MSNQGSVLQSLKYKHCNDGYRMIFPAKSLIFMLEVHYGCNIKCSWKKHTGIRVEYWSLNYMPAYKFSLPHLNAQDVWETGNELLLKKAAVRPLRLNPIFLVVCLTIFRSISLLSKTTCAIFKLLSTQPCPSSSITAHFSHLFCCNDFVYTS